MSLNSINSFGMPDQYAQMESMSYEQRIGYRQSLLAENALCPVAQPSMAEIMNLQGFYNGCLGNIDQLRYGTGFPNLPMMMNQNPQMMMMFMMYQQMQMQNMMLMMMLMNQQNSVNKDILNTIMSMRGGNCQNSINSGNSGALSDANKSQINNLLENAANKYGIPPDILKSIAWQESGWNPKARGDGGASYGMMQIYTEAHPDYNAAEGERNIAYNIDYGAKFLRSLYDKYGDWAVAVERYNGSGPMAKRYAQSVIGHVKNKPWLA